MDDPRGKYGRNVASLGERIGRTCRFERQNETIWWILTGIKVICATSEILGFWLRHLFLVSVEGFNFTSRSLSKYSTSRFDIHELHSVGCPLISGREILSHFHSVGWPCISRLYRVDSASGGDSYSIRTGSETGISFVRLARPVPGRRTLG